MQAHGMFVTQSKSNSNSRCTRAFFAVGPVGGWRGPSLLSCVVRETDLDLSRVALSGGSRSLGPGAAAAG